MTDLIPRDLIPPPWPKRKVVGTALGLPVIADPWVSPTHIILETPTHRVVLRQEGQ